MWKNNGEFSASNIFHFLNLIYYIFCMMRKCSPNTPQEISASKLAENEDFCGNLRYGDDFQKSRKKVIFENCIKNLSIEKIEMFDVF